MQACLSRSLVAAGLLIPIAFGSVAARANIISFNLLGNSNPVNQAGDFSWAEPIASVDLDFAADPSVSDFITLTGATSSDPIYTQHITVRNNSGFTWYGYDLSISGTAGGIVNAIAFSNPGAATANTTLSGQTPVFARQSFTSANDIVFGGGALAPGKVVVFTFDVNIPVTNNDFTEVFGQSPIIAMQVPEPTSLGLLALPALGLGLRRRHARREA